MLFLPFAPVVKIHLMTKLRVIPRQRRPRSATLWILLGNAVLLACVMLWHGIVETASTQSQEQSWSQTNLLQGSNKGLMPRLSPEIFGISAKARKHDLSFRHPMQRLGPFQGIEESDATEVKDEESKIANGEDSLPRDGGVDHKIDSRRFADHGRLMASARRGRLKGEGTGSNSTTMKIFSKFGTMSSNTASQPCSDFDGVLHIKSGDQGAACGAMKNLTRPK